MKLIYVFSIAFMILVAVAVSDQQAGDQERDTSVAEWMEQYRVAEQEADAKKNEAEREKNEGKREKNEAEREADAKKNEALAGLVAALNRSAAVSEASARASERRIARASEKGMLAG